MAGNILSLNLHVIYVLSFSLLYAVLSVPCSLVITGWERADLLTLLCVVCSYVFVTFPYGVPGQVGFLVVSIPDLCLPLYFENSISANECML